ncbi:MAG TPA: regulatory protein RecX [Stellaceae bacterium]|nr:regulatory protein RecX [Stellaceae bacterium]
MPETRTRSRRRSAPGITPAALENAALHYLQRYAASSAQLRRVLRRRVLRASMAGEVDTAAAHAAIDGLVERYLAAGLLDDRRYAEAQAQSLGRHGTSRHRIRQRLAAKGVDAELVEDALRVAAEESGASDLAAACILARRKRLGPYRKTGDRAAHRQKDLAALARAGFSLAIARRVLSAPDIEAVERLARGDED